MFTSTELNDHLKTSNTIKTASAVYVEWNMNDPDNIERLGNYRNRPEDPDSQFYKAPSNYDFQDTGGFYTGATDCDITVQGGVDSADNPIMFTSTKENMKLLYSLEDCTKPYRPRSGINKVLYLGTMGASAGSNQYIDSIKTHQAAEDQLTTVNIARRPRYYISSRDDQFKYWTSYRTEVIPTVSVGATTPTTTVERGISKKNADNLYPIDDAAPFMVYKTEVPVNRVVLKMQTNTGDIDLGPFRFGNNPPVADPLFGQANRTVPRNWKIDVLKDNSWVTVKTFDEYSTKPDGTPLIGSDGHVEISYGLIIPKDHQDRFSYAGEVSNSNLLPDPNYVPIGYAWLVKPNVGDIGLLYIANGGGWDISVPVYRWDVSSDPLSITSQFVTKFVNPDSFLDISGNTVYREFEYIRGVRVVVDYMNKNNSTFDLIEISSRMVGDITELTSSFNITKTISDLGNNSIPVGSLLASTGTIEIFDPELAFNENNVDSILSNHISMPAKFLFYDIVREVGNYDYWIPVKTLYSEGFPQSGENPANITIQMRDMFAYLESMPAPQLLMTDVSLSYAVSMMLDYVGFSNYTFKRVVGYNELVMPYFFVAPDTNCAEVLQQLAVASQSAMFFDEYNNLVVMSKEYMLPNEGERNVDVVLYGSKVEGDPNLPNIINLASREKRVYNSGQIDYTTRYIQRSIGDQNSVNKIDQYKQYVYKPSLLWEVAGTEAKQTINEIGAEAGGYTLSAVPLNSRLTQELPYVSNNKIYNNVIDLGEGVYWLSKYFGYFYANGEIIRFDAIEYSVQNLADPVWISSNKEYQDYFSNLKFNGKMYPTGNVRIWTEPEYEEVNGETRMKDGPVSKSGRGQFGTAVVQHLAGLTEDTYWTSNDNLRGCYQDAENYLFNMAEYVSYPSDLSKTSPAGTGIDSSTTSKSVAEKSTRNGVIKNFLSERFYTDNEINYFKSANTGTIQSSALVFTGPQSFASNTKPSNMVSYVCKDLAVDANLPRYQHFGTRLRIIGKIESGTSYTQTPSGMYSIYSIPALTSSTNTSINNSTQDVKIYGGSGGVGFGINSETNAGYYFEIAALTVDNIDQYTSTQTSAGFNILSTPAPKCVNGVVTVYTDFKITYQVGQTVIITGLVDAKDQTNTRTALNGEYKITAINNDNKSFQYTIPSSTLNTTSITGGTVSIDMSGAANIANMFFYKVVSDSKSNTVSSYSVSSKVLTVKTASACKFVVGDIVSINVNNANVGTATAKGIYTVKSVTNNTITFDTTYGSTISNTVPVAPNNTIELAYPQAIPYKLWSGLGKINVDDGNFTGQYRFTGEQDTTVYDLSVEYVNVGTARRFYLYVNEKQVATVDDTDPLAEYSNMALFTRGSSRIMFENIYALANSYSKNSSFTVASGISKVFGDTEVNATEALRQYALSGMIQQTYLSSISSLGHPPYAIYFDEFGTIMRECAYMNIKYDRAWPSLYSKMMKTYNRVKGYSVSGFYGGAYSADFLIFNCTDSNLNLDDTSGNYLRIMGIAFTQNTTYTLTVDDYFKKRANLSDPVIGTNGLMLNPNRVQQEYDRIRNSRMKYGNSEFTLETPYIQTTDVAEDTFGWIIDKISKPKKLVGVNTFATQTVQLGDIVSFNYTDPNSGIDVIAPTTMKFVVYNISYQKSSQGLSTTLYVVEV
jgi:hypothetical protein